MNEFCYNCGENEFTILYSARSFDSDQKEYKLGRCKSCNLVNTLAASKVELSSAYSQSYYRSSTSKFTWIIEYVLSFLTKIQAIRFLNNWRKRSNMQYIPSVLDIGCGRGKLLHEFDCLGAKTQGLERQEFPKNELNSNVYIGELTDTFFDSKKFDIVILWHVLEHLENTESLISDIVKHMNSNANLIISVPNFNSFQQRIFGQHWFHLDLPRHLIHLEPDWLVSRLKSQGLTIERASNFDPVQNCYGFIQSALNYLSPENSNEFYKMLQYGPQQKNIKFVFFCFAAALLTPFAILESILSSIAKSGSTITIIARLRSNHD